MPTHEQTVKALTDARRVVAEIGQAETEEMANGLEAVAKGYVMALCDQLLIDHAQWNALLNDVAFARRAWVRPERGQGGAYQ
ncbi:hypothetical protein IAI52_27935 [Pseudomonas lurida]|uniref:hypothetical protein n=1 Tax=Pseudomonas lurida TaxID=244566 RepID=UPI001656F3D8|nr:hypothetical protein [Pseudomonas lurida]MBC8984082.1 hypothetical protein [Pseudomonas lurida]